MTVTNAGSAWNPILIKRPDNKWGSFLQGSTGAGASVEALGDTIQSVGTVGVIGSGAAVEQNSDVAAGGVVGNSWLISATGLGAKGNAQVYEDFESISLGNKSPGALGASLTLSQGAGTTVINTKSASGAQCLRQDFEAQNFPELFRALSGTNRRAYLSVKLWIEGAGNVHVWKFGRIGSNDVYGGLPHAGSSWSGGSTVGTFAGEIVNSNGLVAYWAQNTSTANPTTTFAKGQWLFYELEFDAGTINNSDCTFYEIVDGVKTVIWQNQPYLTSASPLLPTWLLTPFNGWDIATGMVGYLDELYIDESRARVVLTDNAVYANSTKREIQPVQSWTYNAGTGITDIIATKRGGSSFVAGDNCYLHTIIDSGALARSDAKVF